MTRGRRSRARAPPGGGPGQLPAPVPGHDAGGGGPRRGWEEVILTVSPRGLSLQDAESRETMETISIYRISYCTTDKLQNKVFAYVAQNPQNGALECHAFLSPKKKMAQAVALTVAQAFQMALHLWEAAQRGSGQEQSVSRVCAMEGACQTARSPVGSPPFEEEEEDLNGGFSGDGRPCFQDLLRRMLPG